MAVYAIGDLQGCYDDLRRLLDELGFEPGRDRLWFVGDLVNRGPQSLQCLRFVHELAGAAVTVLGNHDLSLLATAEGFREPSDKDTFEPILNAPDRGELLSWLRRQPLFHLDAHLNYAMVHAGLAPQWTIETAEALSGEVQTALAGEGYRELLAVMYGDEPAAWHEALAGTDRLRFIINAMTRMRYCTTDGHLNFSAKGRPGEQPDGLMPWYEAPGRQSRGTPIVFGHWSTLGCMRQDNVYSLDTGCVWGGRLTAMRLDTGDAEPAYTHVACSTKREPGL
jgi:bis(5'-nucleosyl)-tetraphosphatase (symmetrical)